MACEEEGCRIYVAALFLVCPAGARSKEGKSLICPAVGRVQPMVQVVRKDMGYPPLATLFSQMVGAQAATNVMMGRQRQ